MYNVLRMIIQYVYMSMCCGCTVPSVFTYLLSPQKYSLSALFSPPFTFYHCKFRAESSISKSSSTLALSIFTLCFTLLCPIHPIFLISLSHNHFIITSTLTITFSFSRSSFEISHRLVISLQHAAHNELHWSCQQKL